MKKGLITITTLLGVLFMSCQKPETVINVTGVSLDPNQMTLVVGESGMIQAKVTPENADNKGISWSSSNSSVARVSDGKVLAISEGETVITVTTEDGGFTANCKITVLRETIHVSSISVSPSTLSLEEGESATLTVNVLPANADDKSYTWSSSNTEVATVDENGKVTAIKAGEAQITATTTDGALQSSCAVSVDIIRPKSVSLDIEMTSVFIGDEFTLTATVNPSNAVNKEVSWSSSDPAVASVDQNGKVSALSEGTATITVTTVDGGLTASCNVNVSICHPQSVSLNYTSFSMSKGDTLQLEATVSPEKAENKAVTWSSSDESLAIVDENGLVTALGPGEVTITVTTVDGGKTATCVLSIQDSGDFTGGNEGYEEIDLN